MTCRCSAVSPSIKRVGHGEAGSREAVRPGHQEDPALAEAMDGQAVVQRPGGLGEATVAHLGFNQVKTGSNDRRNERGISGPRTESHARHGLHHHGRLP